MRHPWRPWRLLLWPRRGLRRRPPGPLGFLCFGGIGLGAGERPSRRALRGRTRKDGRRRGLAVLGGVSGAQLVLHAGQCRRTSSAVVSTASRPRTLRLSAARRPVVSAAVPWATVPICALWGSPAGTFLPDLIVSVPRCGDVSLRPLVLQVLPPPATAFSGGCWWWRAASCGCPCFCVATGFPAHQFYQRCPPATVFSGGNCWWRSATCSCPCFCVAMDFSTHRYHQRCPPATVFSDGCC